MNTERRKNAKKSQPTTPQSVAALLPEEIVDSILAQFGFNYSLDATVGDQQDRHSNLNNMSVVAEGWTRAARRLLFRTVRIREWSHLQEEVEEGMGEYVRELDIREVHGAKMQEVARAIFRLLKRLPNLRRLRLDSIPLDSFDPTDSASMRSAVLLPHLHDLDISHMPSPSSLIVDLLATSGHRIDRLSVYSDLGPMVPPVTYRQLDFRGKLRILSTGPDFYRTLVDPHRVAPEGLRGLGELQLQGSHDEYEEGGEELYRVIGPTLHTLSVESDDLTWFANFLPVLSNLSRVSIDGVFSIDGPDPAPLLRCLPPSLSFLRLNSDAKLGPTLARWTAVPSLVPARLQQFRINIIHNFETYRQLPPIPKLSTDYRSDTINHLGELSPNTLPFTTLDVWFPNRDLGQRSVVQAECSRLGVVFRQRVELWDD